MVCVYWMVHVIIFFADAFAYFPLPSASNEWNPRDYDPLITLLETWRPPLLPPFIHDNIVDQLILPKLTKEVTDWNPRHDPVMIHTWLHPWLPVLGADRLAPLFATVRQKLIVALRQWHPSDPSALRIIDPWRDVFSSADMETLIVKAVLPRLVAILRTEFTVNPRDQKTEPLQWVMAWRELLSPVHMGQLLEQEMFVKWASALYTWLVASPNFDDVAQWYSWWKSVLDGYGVVHANPIVQSCLRRGLDMMNQAAAGIKVNPPITPSASSSSLAASLSSPGRVSFAAAGSAVAGSAATMPRPAKSAQAIGPSVTFKDLLEEWAQSNNLLFLPTTKVHETSGRPLFRLGVGAGSVLVYVDNSDDLVFVREDAARWVPVDFDGLLEVVKKRERRRV
ncbi:GC-rich sequence DNA-binding factor-like protein-domain-containing protein [Jimgerdemannia flammicorona]|uniref:GC-rich sequence DNA-binding factor-like protein-domain-containing protein n=1 Tax=Jimgerdemannia flammicorona TaxID=994334 RepID=A0A433Q4L4_9FUNG|nr:GC-rich sequence DNA-binding factor-like protein-domain-containing protein [Jimgerdemannia flammicorona]